MTKKQRVSSMRNPPSSSVPAPPRAVGARARERRERWRRQIQLENQHWRAVKAAERRRLRAKVVLLRAELAVVELDLRGAVRAK